MAIAGCVASAAAGHGSADLHRRDVAWPPGADSFGRAIRPAQARKGMAITSGGPGLADVSMISDDNFSATQFTRVLNLRVRLP